MSDDWSGWPESYPKDGSSRINTRARAVGLALFELDRELRSIDRAGVLNLRDVVTDLSGLMELLIIRVDEIVAAVTLLTSQASMAPQFPDGTAAPEKPSPRQALYLASLWANEASARLRRLTRCVNKTKAGRLCGNPRLFGAEHCHTHATPAEIEVADQERQRRGLTGPYLTAADIIRIHGEEEAKP